MGFAQSHRDPPIRSGEDWRARGTYAAAQAAVEIKAAPTDANKALYIDGLLVSTDTAGYVQILSNGAEVIPKIYLAANGSGQPQFLGTKAKGGKGENLQVTSDIAGNHTVMLSGYTA